ncbi:unnamed protein product [Parnassius mnemosyne]|uniref:HAT C-terminal dimerisation domain-containing protein n=1 Tax=Parnassius mnemosyne TaxID=213953 RepID=A0AAV1L5Q9_9NEOP
MGRKKSNFVYKYFIYDEHQKHSTCTVNDCGAVIKGNHGTNLLKHMKKHPVQYKLILQENSAESGEHVEVNRKKKSKQDFEIKLLGECINLVTTCGRPLTLIDDKPFQNILDMAKAGCSHSPINSHKIREATQNKADNLRDDIASKIKKQLISLKLDIASCHLRSFLGINLQFIENNQIVIKTLSVTELTQRHTAEFLKDQLIYVLNRFRISISQIYSITTDNGANMLKMVRLVEQALKTSIQENEDDSDDDENEIMEMASDEVNFILEDYLESEHYTVAAVRCAAHTLQLAVLDALGSESSSIQTMLTNAREVIKKLRTTVYQHLLKRMGAKKPVVDCPTRWSSTYDMLIRLLELRPTCTEYYELYLSETTWNSIEITVASLKPSKILTKKLQMEQLTMGDFYLNWINCKIELKAINTTLACELHRNMEIREKVIFESKAFVAAVYMDPRVNFLLTTDQQEIAENALVSAWMRWRKLNKQDRDSTVFSSPVASTSTQQQNKGSQLEDFLDQSYNNTLRGDPSYGCAGDGSDIKVHLKEFLNRQVRLPPSKNILLFWERKKNILPDLYILSKIVLAAPSTQVSVERLFSSLNFVFNKLRTKLKSDLIDDILFLRNNSDNETV